MAAFLRGVMGVADRDLWAATGGAELFVHPHLVGFAAFEAKVVFHGNYHPLAHWGTMAIASEFSATIRVPQSLTAHAQLGERAAEVHA